MTYIRQTAIAAALFGALPVAGLAPTGAALAHDTIVSSQFYDVMKGTNVTIDAVGNGTYGEDVFEAATRGGNGWKAAGRLEEQVTLPDLIRETLTNR